jgi:RHS repeat-associated protein
VAGDPTNGTRTYGYDPLARLTSSAQGTTTTYGWETVPNRSSVQLGANPAATTTYDDANRPVSDSSGGAYGSDDEGRLTARPGQTMTWDTLGRLTQVKNAAGTVTLAAYTCTGAVTNTLRYGPFGEAASTTGTSLPDFRYQGNWYDTTTELSWIITRWYAPSLGRFISEDTLLGEPREPDSRHLYAYAEGEPIGRWDPDGREAKPASYGRRLFKGFGKVQDNPWISAWVGTTNFVVGTLACSWQGLKGLACGLALSLSEFGILKVAGDIGSDTA